EWLPKTLSIPGPASASPSITQGGSRVPESGSHGSVRGVLSNGRPYRDLWFELSGTRHWLKLAPLIWWSFSSPMFRYRLVDHAVPAMWRSLAAARFKPIGRQGTPRPHTYVA